MLDPEEALEKVKDTITEVSTDMTKEDYNVFLELLATEIQERIDADQAI